MEEFIHNHFKKLFSSCYLKGEWQLTFDSDYTLMIGEDNTLVWIPEHKRFAKEEGKGVFVSGVDTFIVVKPNYNVYIQGRVEEC